MSSISSGLLLSILRVIEGYSGALKRLCLALFCKKKEELENNEILLDDLNKDPSDENNNNNNENSLEVKTQNTKNKKASVKKFIDIERKILENVKKIIFLQKN